MIRSVRSMLSDNQNVIIILLFIGLGLRIVQYLGDRSMWYDEAAIVDNILERPISEFTKPLAFNQGAPLGFMVTVKVFSQVLGDGEYQLRLVPLLAGILSVVGFYYLAKRYLTPSAVPLALALFAISDSLVYYASEVKQYSSDVAITIMLLLIATALVSAPLVTWRSSLIWGVTGAALLWFSHPAIFVVAGILVVLLVTRLSSHKTADLPQIVMLGVFWGASFILIYAIQLKDLGQNPYLDTFWNSIKGFMPFPPRSIEDFQWYLTLPERIFADIPLRLYGAGGFAAFLFAVGLIYMLLRDKRKASLALLPILFTLGASVVHKYPFADRLLLFIVPIVILMIAEGTAVIYESTQFRFVGITCVVFLLTIPGTYALAHFVTTPYSVTQVQTIKPLLSHLAANKRPDDIVFINYVTQPAYRYYAARYHLDRDVNLVVANDPTYNAHAYADALPKLTGKPRVWVLMSGFLEIHDYQEQFLPFRDTLDQIGHNIETIQETGSVLYLYDLSTK